MSSYSNPDVLTPDDPRRVINYEKYQAESTAGRFLLKGEDAYWLKRLAAEQNMTVDAFVKTLVLEGLFRRRSYQGIS